MSRYISRRKFLRRVLHGAAALSVLAAGGSVYAAQVEPSDVEVTRVTLRLPNLPREFDSFNLVQISDFHLGEWMTIDYMLELVRQTNALKPDALVLTGDFMSRGQPETYENVRRSVAALHASEGIFAVLGNHDHWEGASHVTAMLIQSRNCRVLRNENTAIYRGNAMLYIGGVDDVWEKQNDLGRTLDGIPADAALIVLVHEPDFADEASRSQRIGLQLSGHSHGGQVRLPVIGALSLPDYAHKYDMGLYNVNGMHLYVNRGLGMLPPYVRFNCRPEITQFTLRSPNSAT